MFSVNTVAPASTALRNPRRRQRDGSEDSVAVRQLSKRLKRSGLSAETFQPPSTRTTNGYLHSGTRPVANGIAKPGDIHSGLSEHRRGSAASLGSNREPDKGRVKSAGDGSIELTKNDVYSVTRLATTPVPLQQHQSFETWRGTFAPSIGYAISTTHRQALVWRYRQACNARESSKPFVIRLLHVTEDPDQPLPLGFLVPSSPEPGLLIVMPTSGEVTYWEALSCAASVDLGRQKQQAVHGIVAGLSHGEQITSIMEAEPQGFLLTISSGKVAHMTVSEPQGKAGISSQLLRSSGAQSGGIFGSLRNVFGGSAWLKDLAAVRAGSSLRRGQRQCALGTTKGLLQFWELNWNGAHLMTYEVDAKSKLLESIRDTGSFPRDSDSQVFKILDFAFLPPVVKGQEVTSSNSKSVTRLLVLTSISSPSESRYNLHVLDIVDDTVEVPVVHPVSCYTTPISSDASSKPQLLVPEPCQTAYIILDKCIILVSLEEIPESPSSQLQAECLKVLDPFQDVIDFRKDKGYNIVGCAADPPEKGKLDSGCTIMVQGYGVVRVTVASLQSNVTLADRAAVTAEAKLEQAVFYGSQPGLLDFSGRSEVPFANEEVQDAALRISRSITASSSKYLPGAGPSMEQQLQRRAIALADLIKHLRKHYQPLDRVTSWKLLWEAEKMAASIALWRIYETVPKNVPEKQKVLLDEMVECLNEDEKVENQPDRHETDRVRHWLTHDVWRLEYLIPWTSATITLLHTESVEDRRPMSLAYHARLISEANDIQLTVMKTAYKFRQENALLYGVDDDNMSEGLLSTGYGGIPEIWTSTELICDTIQKLAVQFQNYAIELDEHGSDDEDNEPSPKLFEKIAKENTHVVDLSCKAHIERSRWLQSSRDPSMQAQGHDLERESVGFRRELLKGLVDVGQFLPAIRLGEKYHDLDALAEVLEAEIESSQEELNASYKTPEDIEETKAKISICEEHRDKYFDRYGDAWADAFFSRFVAQNRIATLLDLGKKHPQYLTTFLRMRPELSTFTWIHQVASERDYTAAADNLRSAQEQAHNIWAKKTQLSISKLALMATGTVEQVADSTTSARIQEIDNSMEILAAQDQVHQIMRFSLVRALNDTAVKTEILMKEYGLRFVKHKPMLRSALEQHMAQLVEERALDTEDLIDAITLLDETAWSNKYLDEKHLDEKSTDLVLSFAARRFQIALKLLRLATFETGEVARKELVEKIVWRRCIIQDNWPKINRTELKGDAEVEKETAKTALFKTLKEGFKTGTYHTDWLYIIAMLEDVLTSSTGFFDDHPPPDPSTLLSIGTSIESLRTSSRYNNVPDSTLSSLAHDLEVEDQVLQHSIEEGRLDQWWLGIVDAARLSARKDADLAGEER
ncbi:MAG: hypothetical protein Q9174_000804, partial [Haloplaca sp. 1 TL-2023]